MSSSRSATRLVRGITGALDSVRSSSVLKQRLLSGSAWALAGKVATAFFIVATNALLARLLSPKDLGSYFIAYNIVLAGQIVGTLGIKQAIVRYVAESQVYNQPWRTRQVIGLSLKIGVPAAVATGLIYYLVGSILGNEVFHAPGLVAVTGLVAIWIVVMAVKGLQSETFRGFHDVRLATAFDGLVMGALLTGCLGLVWLLGGDIQLDTAVLLGILSTGASVLLAGWMMRRKLRSLPTQRNPEERGVGAGEMLPMSLPLLANMLTIFVLTHADIWIVGAYLPQEDVAVYGAAARMVNLVAMPLMIVNAVVPPLIAEMYSRGDTERLERALRACATVAGVPAALTLALFMFAGDPIMGLVYGDYYAAGGILLALISVGKIVSVWAGSCQLTLMMTGKQKSAMWISVLSGALAIVGGIWAVEKFGAAGVAVAVAGGTAIQNVLMWMWAIRATGMRTDVGLSGFSDLMKFAKQAVSKG